MFPFFIAARYLTTRLIVAISICAIASAVVVAYAPNPIFDGYLSEIKAKIRGTSAEVVIETRDPFDAADLSRQVMQADPRIVAAAPRLEATVLFSTGDSVDAFESGQVIGVDPELEIAVSDFGTYLSSAGTQADRPFELKPATLLAALRRESAERKAGREAVASMRGEARSKALKALAKELGLAWHATGAELDAAVDRLQAKYARHMDPEQARTEASRQVKERASETERRLLEALETRKGRELFRVMEPSAARQAVEAERLDQGVEETPAFRARLSAARRKPGVLVSTSTLDEWRELRLGGEIEFVCGRFSGPMEAREDPKGRNLIAVITGSYDSGLYDFDSKTVFMSLPDAQEFFAGVKPIRGLGLRTTDWRNADSIRDRLIATLNPGVFSVTTWRQRREVIIEAVQRQKQVLFVILFFADIVAGFGIFVTLRILVAEKVQDVGIMSAIGASPSKTMSAFLLIGLSIGLVGSLAGVAVGMSLVRFINEIVEALTWLGLTELHTYIHDVQHLKRVPFEYAFATLAEIVAATLFTACVFSLYPAWLASRLKPVDAIRREFL